MYALYNVLSFYSISLADPTTYFVLLQSRSLATGIIYQILFKKQLSALQEPVENFVPMSMIPNSFFLKYHIFLGNFMAKLFNWLTVAIFGYFDSWNVDEAVFIFIIQFCLQRSNPADSCADCVRMFCWSL
jgi:hypothetical protein